ncbi:MAG: helix-turn-helix domain-containing protein [Lachnospiraceae bacterium]|nr:helix-turn-helix domain-containing protein [Lachnospiraceae bacterium]
MDHLFTNSQVSSNRIIYTPSLFARTSLLHLQECGTLTAIRPHVSSRSSLASYLFFMVLVGAGELTYGGQRYELETGDCVYIDCRLPYSQTSGEDLWTLKWCHFYGPNAAAVYRKYKERGGYDVLRASELSAYERVMDELYALATSDSYTRDMQINLKLTELTTLLMEESWHEESQMRETGRVNIAAVKTYIDTHYRDRLSLERLAADFYINKSYLARRFKEQFGLTVAAYIQQVRVGKGKELLRFSAATVEEIGLACGYEDANYFCRVFKKVEGCSPTEYRKMWGKK